MTGQRAYTVLITYREHFNSSHTTTRELTVQADSKDQALFLAGRVLGLECTTMLGSSVVVKIARSA